MSLTKRVKDNCMEICNEFFFFYDLNVDNKLFIQYINTISIISYANPVNHFLQCINLLIILIENYLFTFFN